MYNFMASWLEKGAAGQAAAAAAAGGGGGGAGRGVVLPSAALARMRAQELKALAHSELVALLGLSKKPVGRPTAERIAREGMLGPLEDAFTAACTNGVVATFADWWPDKA